MIDVTEDEIRKSGELCSSELEFYPFCVPCGDKLAELVDEADGPDDWPRLQQETQ